MKNRPETGLFEATKPIYRLGIVLLGLLFVGSGVGHMLSGRANYYHPWGHLVFARFSILIGLSLMVTIIFAWVRNK
jgi:hypothetical protein